MHSVNDECTHLLYCRMQHIFLVSFYFLYTTVSLVVNIKKPICNTYYTTTSTYIFVLNHIINRESTHASVIRMQSTNCKAFAQLGIRRISSRKMREHLPEDSVRQEHR